MRRVLPSPPPHPSSSDLVRAAAEAAGVVAWVLDAGGALVGESPSLCAFTGQPPGACAGAGWQQVLHPEDREAVLRTWAAAAAREGGLEVECRVLRPGGRHTRARLHAAPAGGGHWAVALREVWADASVRGSEERLRLATQAAQVAVWEYDFVAGQMTRTENHDALYGLAPQAVWQFDIFTSATHPEDRALAANTVQAACAPGGADDYAFDFRVVWPDGAVHWLAVSGHVTLRDAEGRATLVRGALIDVTRLKRVEAELREAVRVRDDFLRVASHELNTPLTPLALRLTQLRRLAEDGPLAPDELVRQLDAAGRQVRKLAEQVRDLLEVTRLSSGAVELARADVALADVAREAAARWEDAARRARCALELALDAGVRGCWDGPRLVQAVECLLSNALKYGAGAPVRVSVARAAGGGARLEVRDGGVGIEPQVLGRIFERFERAPGARDSGGLGLGLYLARQLVHAHGGSVWAESEPGRGAAFVVELPP